MIRKPSDHDEIPLYPMITLDLFEKLVVDFVGSINPSVHHNGAHYIITAIGILFDLVGGGCAGERLHYRYDRTLLVYEYFLCFGYPKVLMSDQGTHFLYNLHTYRLISYPSLVKYTVSPIGQWNY